MVRIIFIIFIIFIFYPKEALANSEGLLLYLPFEGTAANSINGQKGEAKNIKFVEGKMGQGAYFDIGSYLRFPPQGNINFRSGTVEFWVKPNWNGDDGGYHYFFAGNISDAKNVNSIHVSKKKYQEGVILGQIDGEADEKGNAKEEAVVPRGGDFSPTSVANWRKDEWHHLAFSWDDKKHTLKLYIDGLLRATNANVSENAFPSSFMSYINIGSSIDRVVFAEGVIDELKIWQTPRTDMEIAESAGLWTVGKASDPLPKSETKAKKEGWLTRVITLLAEIGKQFRTFIRISQMTGSAKLM